MMSLDGIKIIVLRVTIMNSDKTIGYCVEPTYRVILKSMLWNNLPS